MQVERLWAQAETRFGRNRAIVGLGAALTIVATTLGFTAGVAMERHATRDRHAATAAVLTGTVTWSNQTTRLLVFEQDGVVRDPNQGDVVYYVIADTWSDAKGNYFGGTYPECLASKDGTELSTDRRRVALTAIDWATGGAQDMHIALEVHCLD